MTHPSTRSQSHDALEGSRSRGDEPPPCPTMAEVLMVVERNREAQNAVLQQITASAAATAAHIAQGAGGGGHHAAGGLAEFHHTQPSVTEPLDCRARKNAFSRTLVY